MNTRNFTLFIILALLLLFPLISYYYLKEGTNYRAIALNELKESVKLNQFNIKIDSSNWLSNDSIIGKVTLFVYLTNDTTQSDKIETLFDQFKDRKEFSLVLFQDFPIDYNFKNLKSEAKFYQIPNSIENLNYFIPADSSIPSMQLIDVKNNIRKSYNDFSKSTFQDLVKHITVLLPLTPTPKPILNRDKEK